MIITMSCLLPSRAAQPWRSAPRRAIGQQLPESSGFGALGFRGAKLKGSLYLLVRARFINAVSGPINELAENVETQNM